MSNETITAMMTAINAVAETATRKGGKNAVVLEATENAVICGVVLHKSDTASNTRTRVRVALRALKDYFPAARASWELVGVAEWGKLPEAVRAQFADKMPKWDEAAGDTAYVCTGVKA